MSTRTDRSWAWAGALLAAGVSIAVNIAHASPHTPSAVEVQALVTAGLPVTDQVGSWGFAAFSATLPVMVLIAAEQVARRLLGKATLPVMLMIGICAYSLSFWHTVLLLRSWGEPGILQVTGAVAVDGLAVASVIALWFAARPVQVHEVARTATELTFRRGTETATLTPVTPVVTLAPDPEVNVTPKALTSTRVADEVVTSALTSLGWTPGSPLTREVKVKVMTETGVSDSTVKRAAKTLTLAAQVQVTS